MLKSFDMRVQSRYSNNWYDSFRVDTVRGVVYFNQCDARRNGQVARHMQITFYANGTAKIEARSANDNRYEQFSRTQCLTIALYLLEQARSEERQIKSVRTIKPASTDEEGFKMLGTAFLLLTLLPLICTVTLGAEEYLTALRVGATVSSLLLSAYFFGMAYLLKKERESEE